MNYQPRLLLLTMLTFSPITIAESHANGPAPSLDFLEFLGEWQDSDGNWIDPADFEDADFVKLLDITDTETDSPSNRSPGVEQERSDDDV